MIRLVETETPRGKAKALRTELAAYVARVNHWASGRPPTDQQIRELALDLEATWNQATDLLLLIQEADADA